MGLNFFRWLQPKAGTTSTVNVSVEELLYAAQEFQLRNLSFYCCVNLIANALGRCEVRTFEGGEEVRKQNYYRWNVEPNKNQNSSAFWHKLVSKLYEDNEALVIETGDKGLVVADSWQPPEEWPVKENVYRSVRVGQMTYSKSFLEREVLHLKLNHCNMKPVMDGLYASYWRLIQAAMNHYQWENGQHWKVLVNQLASNQDDFEAKFTKMIEAQIKPFLTSNTAVLPVFDGYTYERVGDGKDVKSDEIRNLFEDIFNLTARSMLIPSVLVNGKIEGTADAQQRFLTSCIDPLCDQLQEEINRKTYGYAGFSTGNFCRIDSSSIIHFDLFSNAANIEKIVGSAAFTVNDILRAANQPTINEPWADEHFLTKNISIMGEVVRSLTAQKGENQ